MIGQQKLNIQAGKMPKFMLTSNGCEAISNDGELKIILNHRMAYEGAMEQEYFVAEYYIKEDNGWLKTSTQNTYNSKEAFIDALCSMDEFSEAAEEAEE